MSLVEFKAPWSRSLRIRTVVTMTVLLAVVVIGWMGPHFDWITRAALLGLPIAILCAAGRFAVVGYALTENEILIKHPIGSTRFDLSMLTAAGGKEDAMRGSVCLFANAGLFSISGFFWNRELKLYRAFATDSSRSVILRFRTRTVVITPHDPQHFIVRARTQAKVGAHPIGRNA